MQRVVIVGAGVSGLALAYRLTRHRPDLDVTILEADSRPGGKIHSERVGDFLVEHGPNGFLDSKPSTIQLCRELGLGDELVAASDASRKNRFLFLNERLHKLPGGPLGLLTTRLLSWRGKFDLLRELVRPGAAPPHDESVANFFRRRLGPEAAAVLGDALVTGIHGGDPELLSLAAAFPRAAEMEAKYGSVIRGFLKSAKQRRRDAIARGEPPPKTGRMWSFPSGLGRLITALAERLPRPPLYHVDVNRLERTETTWQVRANRTDTWAADSVILACPADQQARLLADLDPNLAAELAGIAYNRIAVVALGYRANDVPNAPDGFGYIAPQRTGRDLLGVQWCSAIYPDRAPAGCVLWRALCGGWNRADVVDWEDARLLNAVRTELKLAQGVTAEPIFHRIVRWERAIPQYHVGHRNRVHQIETLAAAHPGLILAGNALHGVALNDCTEQAERLTTKLTTNSLRGEP